MAVYTAVTYYRLGASAPREMLREPYPRAAAARHRRRARLIAQIHLVTRVKAAADAVAFADVAAGHKGKSAAAADALAFGDAAVRQGHLGTAADGIAFSDAAFGADRTIIVQSVHDGIRFAHAVVASHFPPIRAADDDLSFEDDAEGGRAFSVSAGEGSGSTTPSWIFGDRATAGRGVSGPAADAWIFTDFIRTNRHWAAGAADDILFTDTLPSPGIAPLGSIDGILFDDLATGVALLGGSGGLQKVLYDPVSTTWPFCYAEDAEGLIFMANGVDPMLCWDGLADRAWPAGIVAPGQAVIVSGNGVGMLTGRRYGFCRFVAADGTVSDFGQWGDWVDLGHDGFINDIRYEPGQPVVVTSYGHRLFDGDVIIILGVDDGLEGGVPQVDGPWTVTYLDDDHFSPQGLRIGSGRYKAGGTFTRGSAEIVYDNLPVTADPRVVRRQVLRNLEGNADVFYVDLDTGDLTSTTLSSSLTDEQLAAGVAGFPGGTMPGAPVPSAVGTAVPLQFEDGEPNSQRHHPPPSHKRAIVAYAGRIWAAADAVVTEGAVGVVHGSTAVRGVATEWTPQLAGRLLYVSGATRGQAILEVHADTQMLVLEDPRGYAGTTDPMASYAIRPAPIERRLVYCSEPNLSQSWPPWSAFAVPETSDEVVGLFTLRGFLYIVKERHLYRFTYRREPAVDGFVFPVAERGCVSNRCWCVVEDSCYLLDENGIYRFDGNAVDAVSQDQPIFVPDRDLKYRIDWEADRMLWGCVHDPMRGRLLWFVDFVGVPRLTMAIAHDYTTGAWWLERYPEAITAECLGVVSGYRQSILGTTGRRAAALSSATLDLAPAGGTLRGTAGGGDTLTLTDPAAQFGPDLVGAPVVFVSGTGAGESAIIVDNTATSLTFWRPVETPADATTVYQVGGVEWTWRGSWRRLADDEAENPRDLEFCFHPTRSPSSLDARIYYDHAPAPAEWAFPWDSDGIRLVAGATAFTVDTGSPRGYAIFRTSGHRDAYGYGPRYQALEVRGVQGPDPQRVFQIVINGAE